MCSDSYDHKCDIWSCGAIIYFLLVGLPPYEVMDDESLTDIVKRNPIETILKKQDWSHLSDQSKDLLKKMLDLRVERRPTASETL